MKKNKTEIRRMKILFQLIAVLIYMAGCANSETGNKSGSKDSFNQKLTKVDSSNFPATLEDTIKRRNIPDFLIISKKAKEATMGYLQGVEKNDSSGPYIVREFISDTLSFDLIFFPKNMNKSFVDFEAIKNAETNDYKDFLCFAFLYTIKTSNNSGKGYHEDNTPYPVVVKSYVKKTSGWEFYSQQEINNLTELSHYEIRTMYANIPK